ncbi:MAG TPA: ABC transporter ATP-binding protein, partial [Candidatus Angelobacter sp.]|nr:ABC transporter ATP-binding protein [Candidatus Angelobacter sp.]
MHKYRRFLQYARPHWHSFALIFIATLAASALAALQPWPMKLLVDHVLGHDPLPHWLQTLLATLSLEPTPSRLLLLIVAAGLALFALNGALEVTLTWAWTLSGRRMVYDLAEELYARLQRRSLLYHTRHAVGDTMGRVVTDSWCVYQVFDACLFAPAHALLTMLVMIVLMAQSDVALTLLALATAPFMLGASFLVGKPLRAAAKLKRDIETRIQSHLQQTLTGIPVVQAFAQEAREEERFHQFADAAIAAQQRSTLIGSVNSLASGLVTTLGIGVILWVGARHVMSGGLSIGSLLVFLVYLTLLQNQMKVLTEVNTKLQGFSASVDRVFGVIDSEPDLKEMPGAIQLVSARGHVRLENVLFGYEPDQAVLRGVSLEALPGQIVAIVGATGAGKTTLVNLLPRFFDPWQGRVLMDGCDLRDLGLRSLRAQIAFVLQEPFLFPVSVAGNIAFGRPESARGEIEAAARAANAHEFIRRLPQG